MNLLTALRKEIIEQWRTSRMLVLLFVLGMFGMLSPLMAKFLPEIMRFVPGGEQFAVLIPTPTVKDAIDQYMKNIGQFALFLAIFIPMGSVVQEKERGTAILMLVKPLGRGSFLLAKFLALALSFFVSLGVAGLLGYYYTLFIFGATNAAAWIGGNLLIWIYCLFYVAVTLLASTISRSQAVAAGAGFGVLLVISILSSIPGIPPIFPNQLLNWGAELFGNPGTTYWPALIVSLGLMAACLLAAWLSFSQQEL